jgi:hypothetical protein
MAESIGQLIGLCLLFYASFWVYKDAKSREMNATVWSIFVLLLLIIGLPLYFIVRKPKVKLIDPIKSDDDKENTTKKIL